MNDFLSVGEDIEVKVLEVDEEQKKISLSIRELQEVPCYRKKEPHPRRSLQDRVDEVDADGFKILKDKLKDWIEQSGQ